ncbi:MAG: response regulator [Candidatus Paceibacterota bacterium]
MKNVLIIEDDQALLKALVEKFTHEGFVVLEAHDGEEGLAKALEEHPAVILLDIVMPKMDGITMLGKLREDVWGKEAKVILLTNLSTADRVSEAVQLGSYEYLVKTDWKIEDVVKKVREKIGS